ncbi:MAG: fructose-6-phosphate aldolase [Candidatus Brocadiae bacterium]|nr:fructose-6-phosphate aldolase [Candidatus Brocadiia bacterium]
MKFFLDTANIDHIKQIYELGLLDGVTTNPSLIAKTGKPFKVVFQEICNLVKGPVSLEVVSTESAKMIEEAHKLVEFGSNVVVKIPMTLEGLKAVKILAEEGIKTNVTLCFSPLQALMAAKAKATYISPFIGRLDDYAHDGMELVREIKTIYDNYGFETEIIVASIRHPLHILDAALLGADIATVPFDVFNKISLHPLTEKGLDQFLQDWKKVPAEKA